MKHLNWFLGPKGENSEFLINSVTSIIQDYVHWRRNYFPSDNILIDNKIKRENIEEFDKISLHLVEMMSELRRNFPFYSPRYIGHMLSDITMPSTLGYIAGMLYNSNNVTPEAAPVTVEWEVEACNNILEMLGFKPSPKPPSKEDTVDDWKQYQKKLKDEFGWAHITSGGTVANIEALWVARIVRYYPLAIQDIAIQEGLSIEIKLPNQEKRDIKTVSKRDILFIKPNESIYLFSKFISSLSQKRGITVAEANILSAKLIEKSEYSLTNHLGKVFSEFQPVVFCSGAAHYSIKKAADILGIGRSNVIHIKTDSQFRMDARDLELKFNVAIQENKVPICVIAVAATTEEGAVDPIHEIVDLRDKLEKDNNKSFWLHIDSAWGGYVSSIFRIDEPDELNLVLNKLCNKFKIEKSNLSIKEKIFHIINESYNRPVLKTVGEINDEHVNDKVQKYKNAIDAYKIKLNALKDNIDSVSFSDFISSYKKISFDFGNTIYFSNGKKLVNIFNNEDFGLPTSDNRKELDLVLNKICDKLMIENFNLTSKEKILQIINKSYNSPVYNKTDNEIRKELEEEDTEKHKSTIDLYRAKLNELRINIDNDTVSFADFIPLYKKISFDFGNTIYFTDEKKLIEILNENDFILTVTDRSDMVSDWVSDKINFSLNGTKKEKTIKWGGKPIISAFLAFKRADSITIDPHKLGYIQYPCGVVAFKNDRVRHFIMQRAPYITSSGHNALIHTPPRHIKNIDFEKIENGELPYENYNVAIDAFAPFMLEGSKPGAAAAALWFSCKTIPLNQKNHGLIIKESLIANRELYEWINTWSKIYSDSGLSEDLAYEFKTFGSIPDTNVLVFAIKSKINHSIEDMNKLTSKVYEEFSIQAELGSREHSYSQSFFLSKTIMDDEHYQYDSFKTIFDSWGLTITKKDYQKSGLLVLRATVMNPYIAEIRRKTKQNLIKEFVWELHKCSNRAFKEIVNNK